MGNWRDEYKVHRSADIFPMMPDEELAKLGEDIKANGLTSPISFFFSERIVGPVSIEYAKADGVLADGRNRLEAMERAGVELTPCAIEAVNINEIDPAAFIIGRNIHRRHLTKQEQCDLIVAALKAAEQVKVKGCQAHTVFAAPNRGGRGKINPLKQEALAIAMERDRKRTMQRSLAKGEGKKPKARRTDSEIEHDRFLSFVTSRLWAQNESGYPKLSDSALDLFTAEEIADAVETMETNIALTQKVAEQLRL